MNRGPIGTGRLPALGGYQATIFLKYRGRSPDPLKTHPGHGAVVAGWRVCLAYISDGNKTVRLR